MDSIASGELDDELDTWVTQLKRLAATQSTSPRFPFHPPLRPPNSPPFHLKMETPAPQYVSLHFLARLPPRPLLGDTVGDVARGVVAGVGAGVGAGVPAASNAR